jgi:predicted glycogen debranching enzyme
MIKLPRDICIDVERSLDKEWLVANGTGGFASGTVAGVNTRRYHGLLVAALQPPVERTVLVANLDLDVELGDRTFYLGANEYPDGKLHPAGYVHIEDFRLEDNIPTTTYRLGDVLLRKTVWMEHEHNTAYVRFEHAEGNEPFCLVMRPLCAYRDYHALQNGSFDREYHVEPLPGGCRVTAHEGAQPYWLSTHPHSDFTHTGVWYWNFVYRREVERGFTDTEDLYMPGICRHVLQPGEHITFVASTEPPSDTGPLVIDSLRRERERVRKFVRASRVRGRGVSADPSDPAAPFEAFAAQLVRAADTFVVERTLKHNGATQHVPTVLAGYHWFADWGRDTMISLPGLALPTGRVRTAGKILRTFAHFAREGLIPNNFPDQGIAPHYNTVDATLWMFAAVERIAEGTGSLVTAHGLYPLLSDIVAWHVKGTRYGIAMDPGDALLRAGEGGVQLTWMDAKVDDWVVTPRIGKPVEINALWYNALRVMEKLRMSVGGTVKPGRLETPDFSALAEQVKHSFRRCFWNNDTGYLYDVVDGPEGDDASLRPNQLLALSLRRDLLNVEQARGVLDAVRSKLLTPYGLRTLSPDDPRYTPTYTGDRRTRDGAYHMGTVWPWLLGPYFDAVIAVDGPDAARAEFLSMLPGLRRHLADAGLGSVSEIFDAAEPYTPRGCISQAWSVAELLRVMQDLGLLG